MRYRPVVVATGRHPFEVAFLIACAIVGPLLIIGDGRPKSVTTAMPTPIQVVWEFGLAIAGVLGLVAILGRWWTLGTALAVELIAMAIAGTALTMYAIAVVAVNGSAATVAGAFAGAFAIGSWLRLAQIMRDMRRAGRAAQAGAVAEVPLLVEEQRE